MRRCYVAPALLQSTALLPSGHHRRIGRIAGQPLRFVGALWMSRACRLSGCRESFIKCAYNFFKRWLYEYLKRPVNDLARCHFLLYFACLALDLS
jgi:hypothetical protein